MRTVVGVFTLLFLLPASVFAHGFANYVQGGKSFATGGAFTAVADDSSAIFHNPAGIHQLAGNQILIGFTDFFPAQGQFSSSGTSDIPGSATGLSTDNDSDNHLVPYLFATCKKNAGVSFGLGLYSPFGQASKWPDDWEGRYTPGGVEASIESYRLEPVIAFALNTRTTLSVGVFMQNLDIEIRQKYWLPGEFGARIEGDDMDFGYSAALLFAATENLKFGLSYKSEVRHDFTGMSVKIEPQVPLMGLTNTRAKMTFSTPAMLFAGVAYRLGKWTFSFDTYWTEWSVQNRLVAATDSIVFGDIVVDKGWRDTFTYGAGLQYALTASMNLYAGYIYDESPVSTDKLDSMVPHGDSQVACLGFDYHQQRCTITLAIGYVWSEDRLFDNAIGDAANPGGGRVTGTFEDNSQTIISMSMAWRF